MNDLQIFEHDSFGKIRMVTIDGNPWFVGKDVAAALGYEKPTDAVRKRVDMEDRGVSKLETPSGKQELTIINESGLYSLVMSSKLPTARVFKRWVTSEVLPSIRRTGQYRTPEADPVSRDDYLRAAAILATCQEERMPMVLRLLEQAGIHVTEPGKDSAGHRPGDADENTIRLVLDFIQNNMEKFSPDTKGEAYGFLRDGGETVFIFPRVLYKELEKAGYSPRKTLRYLAQRGVIAVQTYGDGKKKAYTKAGWCAGKCVRCVAFSIPAGQSMAPAPA